MDNGFTERQCPHDKCLNHNPEFGKSTEEKADFKPSRLFKMATRNKKEFFCCKKKMKVELINLFKFCESCGRKESWPYGYAFLCECCGFHTKIDEGWVRDRENDIKAKFWFIPLIISLIALFVSAGFMSFGIVPSLGLIIFFVSIIMIVVSVFKVIK